MYSLIPSLLRHTFTNPLVIGDYCPAGFISDLDSGSTSCSACPQGKYSGISGVDYYYSFGYGQSPDNSECLDCPAGRFTSSTVSYACDQVCPAGTYSSTKGSSSVSDCVACPTGKFNSEVGQSACKSTCGAGYYYDFEPFSATTCSSLTLNYGCQLGYDGDNVENVRCNGNFVFDYYPYMNKTAFYYFGKDYVNSISSTTYVSYYRVYVSDGDTTNYNYYYPWISTSNETLYSSTKVTAGYNSYQNAYGDYDKSACCNQCPTGAFCDGDDYNYQLCPPGSYSDSVGSSSCTLCPR